MRAGVTILAGCLAIAGAVTLVWAGPPQPGTVEREILDAHNRLRAGLHEPPLEWSPRLAAVARDWADRLAANGQFFHRPYSDFGENLYMVRPAPAAPAEVVETWAAEAAAYDYRSNSCRQMCGHYTQLVWRETSAVGCAVSRFANREVWVCNYFPAGNVIGQRPY